MLSICASTVMTAVSAMVMATRLASTVSPGVRVQESTVPEMGATAW